MTEVQLQSQIAKLLDRLNIVYIRSRTDKRSTTQAGTPDFIFCVETRYGAYGYDEGIAWEIKLPGKKLDPDQITMRDRMLRSPNAWRHSVITSVDQAIEELKAMGLIC